MEYYKIADNTLCVEWEDERGRDEFYSRLGVCFNPVYLGAYELSDLERDEIEEYDMHVYVRKLTEAGNEKPENYTVIENQVYYKKDGNFCITFLSREDMITPVMTIKTYDNFKRVEMIPHNERYNVYSLNLLSVIFQQMLPLQNGFMYHSAAIEYKNRGIIFTGFSGSGKSTQARLWRKYRDAIVVNGDSPIIKNEEDGVFIYGAPWCGTSGESVNRKVALDAIVIVKQSRNNRVEEVTGDDAVLAVYTNILYFSQDKQDLDRLLLILPEIVNKIKVVRLYCNMQEEAVDTLETAIFGGK